AVFSLGEQLSRLASEVGRRRLVLNLGNVGSLGSLALSQLITCQKRIQAAGGRLILCNLNPSLLEILRTTRMDHMFNIWGHDGQQLLLERSPATAPLVPEEESHRRGTAIAPVAICDPRPEYGELLGVALAQDLPIVRCSTLTELEQYCRRDLPA